MRIITRKKQNEIAKRLAAIYHTAVHWEDKEWSTAVKCVVGNVAEIGFAVGGLDMMNFQIPALVEHLNRRVSEDV